MGSYKGTCFVRVTDIVEFDRWSSLAGATPNTFIPVGRVPLPSLIPVGREPLRSPIPVGREPIPTPSSLWGGSHYHHSSPWGGSHFAHPSPWGGSNSLHSSTWRGSQSLHSSPWRGSHSLHSLLPRWRKWQRSGRWSMQVMPEFRVRVHLRTSLKNLRLQCQPPSAISHFLWCVS